MVKNEALSEKLKEHFGYTGEIEIIDLGGSVIIRHNTGNERSSIVAPYDLTEFKGIRESGEDVIVYGISISIKGLKKDMDKVSQSKEL